MALLESEGDVFESATAIDRLSQSPHEQEAETVAVMLKGANFPAVVVDRGLNVVIWNAAIATATSIDLDVDVDDGTPIAFASLPFVRPDVFEQSLSVVNELLQYDAEMGAAEVMAEASAAGPPPTRAVDMRLWTGRGEVVLRMTASLIVLEHDEKGVSLYGQVESHNASRRVLSEASSHADEISSLTDSGLSSHLGTCWRSEGGLDSNMMRLVKDQLSGSSGHLASDESSGAAEVAFWTSSSAESSTRLGTNGDESTRRGAAELALCRLLSNAESSAESSAESGAESGSTISSNLTWQKHSDVLK